MMSALGPFCHAAGITEAVLESGQLPVLHAITNGLALELKNYCDSNKYTSNKFLCLLAGLNTDFKGANATAVVNKLKYVKEQKKKLVHKKKVKGYKDVTELLTTTLTSPAARVKHEQNSPPKPSIITSPNVQVETVSELCNKSVQTEIESETLKSEVKELNVLNYKTRVQQQKLNKVKADLNKCQESIHSLKGHYSVKNVNKRDVTARRNLHKLRDSQRKLIRQDRLLKLKSVDQSLLVSLKNENEKLKRETADFEDQIDTLTECLETERAKKITLQKSNSYMKSEVASLRLELNSNQLYETDCSCEENVKKMKLEFSEKEQMLSDLEDEIQEMKANSIKTKNDKGVYSENVRLCIMELAGLEVACEKMSSVIRTVVAHILGKEIKDLPNATTSQKIVDEGHFLCKTFIADKLDAAQNWGLGRDGTTRRKQKILDTAITLNSGDVISLGFTRVANETARTIQDVTQNHLTELSSMKTRPEYLAETLSKLSFTMSDRASNEKLADKLLDEWRDSMLEHYEGDKEDVSHFHCMAHVLLGLHNYITPDLKDFEKSLHNDTGPLGRDALSFFNSWSKKETVVNRVVRTVSDTFGPAGDHLGVRDRWEAFCSQNGVKSLIGNYRDNRFNAFFQTSAEVFLHRADFIKVLETVSKPNLKLKSVKSDLESDEIAALLQCLGLFYLKLTGPYWNLVTCGKIPYMQLYKQVEEIEKFLETTISNPAHLLRKDQHWSSHDPLDITNIPNYRRLSEALFEVHEKLRGVLFKVIPVVAAAMLKCVKKQLVDFLAGGKFNFNNESSTMSHPSTDFAPVTNLSCEHHFGDLDASQKRRPHASFHHHSSIQMLKRNRKQLIHWMGELDGNKKSELMTVARKGGKTMRKEHQEHERQVVAKIHENMMTEKDKKMVKSAKRKSSNTNQPNNPPKRQCHKHPIPNQEDIPAPPEKLCVNDYVVVAYQDNWYPGCVEKQIDENTFHINFMSPCRKDGYFQWPHREDKQIVERQFILRTNFVPDCVSSGRQWYIKEHNLITDVYAKFHATFF